MGKSWSKGMGGVKENKMSHEGEDNKKGGRGSETVHDIEHVGSSGAHGVRFGMPKEVVDHSNVRSTLKE
jgi:hypothetical protein